MGEKAELIEYFYNGGFGTACLLKFTSSEEFLCRIVVPLDNFSMKPKSIKIYVAMRKLAFCMDRPYKADRIMDCVAGLEGLLVDEKNEIRHKFVERISILLETKSSNRADLLKEMKEAYDLRSDIAHGSKVADDFDTIFSLGKQPKKEEKEKYDNIQKLEPKVMDLLFRAILICIDKETTDFKWDSSLMGTKVKPF